MPPTYSSLVRILAVMTGSSIETISVGSGQREGLSTSRTLPSVIVIL